MMAAEYTITVPSQVGYLVADTLYRLTRQAGGCTSVRADGSWFNPEGQRVNESVNQLTFIVPYDERETFLALLREVVRELHFYGEHTVLVRRLDGRGLVHWFITKGNAGELQ